MRYLVGLAPVPPRYRPMCHDLRTEPDYSNECSDQTNEYAAGLFPPLPTRCKLLDKTDLSSGLRALILDVAPGVERSLHPQQSLIRAHSVGRLQQAGADRPGAATPSPVGLMCRGGDAKWLCAGASSCMATVQHLISPLYCKSMEDTQTG